MKLSTDAKVTGCVVLPVVAALAGLTFNVVKSFQKFSEPPKLELKLNNSYEKQVEQIIQQYSRQHALPATTGVGIACYDWKAEKSICQINANEQMQLASVVKVFIATAYLIQMEKNPKDFPINQEIIARINQMIIKSDNKMANWFIDRLGGIENVSNLLKTKGIKINLLEKIPSSGSTYKNTATSNDIINLYKCLLKGEIKDSQVVISALKKSERTRIFKGIEVEDKGNKTGTTDHARNDTGFINNLIVVVMITEYPGRINQSSLSFFHSDVTSVFLTELKN